MITDHSPMQTAFEATYPGFAWDETDPAIQDIWRKAWCAACAACESIALDRPRPPVGMTEEMRYGYDRGYRKAAVKLRAAIAGVA